MSMSFNSTLHTVKILLVDDLKDNLLALDALLKRDGLEIFKARSGTEALALMLGHEFAVALIDVQMPEMSGFELAEYMRGTNQTKNVPIIFVTATAKRQSFSFKGYESGAVDFLLKPLDGHAVKSKVNIFVQLYLSQKEQKDLLIQLTQVQAKLEQAIAVRDEFMSIASHELKTPLTSLALQGQLRQRNLAKGNAHCFTPETLAKMFASDARQVGRINHLIDDMLDVSRINSGKLSLNLGSFDLSDAIRELLDQFAEQFRLAGCEAQTDIDDSILGHWDRVRIEQVVTNLLTNAMRYGAGKPVSVQVKSDGKIACITVTDHGRGIDPIHQARIFERFERVITQNAVSGLGLGLYIARQILVAHQGHIQVSSSLGHGSQFTVHLPQNADLLASEGDQTHSTPPSKKLVADLSKVAG